MDYNPHDPQVLGQEWVPINQADYTPDAISERGYRFTLSSATPSALQGGSFTVAAPPVLSTRHTAQLLAIYPAGTTADTGPIVETVTTPETQSITNAGVYTLLGGATDIADALESPNDAKGIQYASDTGNAGLDVDLFFTLAIPAGRRIISVALDYQVTYPASVAAPVAAAGALKPWTQFSYLRPINQSQRVPVVDPAEESLPDAVLVRTGQIGECNFFWDSAAVASTRTEIMPWTSTQLGWFAFGTGTTQRLAIKLRSGSFQFVTPGLLQVGYVGLRVRHCVENRVKFGAFHRREAAGYSPVAPGPPGGAGTQYVSMRNTSLAKTVLAAGIYDITSCNVYAPDPVAAPFASPGTPPPMNAIRQLNPVQVGGVPTFVGLLVRRTTDLGAAFTTEDSDILPPLTLGYSTGPTLPVLPVHSYARQVQAPVFGAITATQRLLTGSATGLAYRSVTFIARRFPGSATPALTVASVQTPAATATITAAAFDALPEIIDGWRQVTLQFASPVTIAASSTQDIAFSAATAAEGVQWQILGAQGVDLTAVNAGDLTWDVPLTNYGGDGALLTWRPTHLTAATADREGDLFLMLSADPAPVTGFTATVLQADVPNDTGTDPCGDDECCIPTEIDYVRLAWTASTLPQVQFGEYRLQRKNSAGVWETIMVGPDVDLNLFDDFEAVVGLNEYRMQVVDAAGVVSLTQPLASATIAAPGVTTLCGSNKGLLVLTSNSLATGNRLAYKKVWQSDPEEAFLFPEADEVELQRMYLRDYQVGFHGTERGGTIFLADLLVRQNIPADGSPVPMANFDALRDLAWADIPYVCVRDELGNRWYMTVIVPEGAVNRIGRTYVARAVRFVQTTATPAPVTALPAPI